MASTASLGDEFFKYYGMLPGQDGRSQAREGADRSRFRIGKMPYCIDAYTTACLEAGANPEQ